MTAYIFERRNGFVVELVHRGEQCDEAGPFQWLDEAVDAARRAVSPSGAVVFCTDSL